MKQYKTCNFANQKNFADDAAVCFRDDEQAPQRLPL